LTDWWSNASSLATGAGTLVLAVATFASVRSANRSARVAETALQEQRRPVLVHSRLDDPVQKIMFVDQRWVRVAGSRAAAEHVGDVVYLAMSLRNLGSGIAVLQSWAARPGLQSSTVEHIDETQFRGQTRDLYVPAGDVGIWQGALRDPQAPGFDAMAAAVDGREPFTIEIMYTDNVGGQRTISRFTITPMPDDAEWMVSVGRHWYLDGVAPR
jgi:hypothetical protein